MKFLLLLLMVACTSTVEPTKPETLTRVPIPVYNESTPVVTPEIVPVKMVNITKLTGFRESEKIKLLKYIPKMNETVASNCFRDFMLKRDLKKTNGLSKADVIYKLRYSTVDIELITYYKRWSKVAGYTKPGANWIKLNRKYHAGASLCSEGSNLAHELSHKIGFGHNKYATRVRPYSVPYSINAAFKECCK